jgi:hypothetical protein
VVKAWPWVPIGYAPAFSAHRERIGALLAGLPGTWEGVFLNDLQAGPSSCGCGNDQCRWALDYGTPATAPKATGPDAAARLVAEVRRLHPGKAVVPVWVTECEPDDLADARPSTGLCGTVPCAATSCLPRYAETWGPLLRATSGPIALAAWSETFRRDPSRWPLRALELFQHPPRGGSPLPDDRTLVVLQAWGRDVAVADRCLELAKRLPTGWVLALDPVEQSWEPRLVDIP